MRSRTEQGFTLIELLIVVAIIGIIAAIAIPNLLAGINRGRQKRTMADIRSVATAVESYAIDNGYVPNEGAGPLATSVVKHVAPTFIRTIVTKDGWKRAMTWDQSGGSYTIVSGGAGPAITGCGKRGITTQKFDADICYSDGQFVQYPEGTQEN